MSLGELTEVAAVHIPILTTTPLHSSFAGDLSRGGPLIARKLRAASDPLSRYSRCDPARCVCKLLADFSDRGCADRARCGSPVPLKSISGSAARVARPRKTCLETQTDEQLVETPWRRGIPIIIRSFHFCGLNSRSLAAKILMVSI